MMNIIDIQGIALRSLKEIQRLLDDNKDFRIETEVPELDPTEEFSFAIVVSILVYYNGDEPYLRRNETIFHYEVLLERDQQGLLHVFLMDMTVRSDQELTDIDLANRELKNRLTVFNLGKLSAEEIVKDFFVKLKTTVAWNMKCCFSEN